MLRKIYAERREQKRRANELRDWSPRGWAAPSPPYVKREVILRNSIPQCYWVETGTFTGDTTTFLASWSRQVYTIEPEPTLFSRAMLRFQGSPNVSVIHGLSEVVLPDLLPKLRGHVHFWLDGHYSGGITHQGPTDCPVLEELRCIQENITNFERVAVLIDDVRCFDPSNPLYSDYPPLDHLVDWARRNNLIWHIEHDIFVARSAA